MLLIIKHRNHVLFLIAIIQKMVQHTTSPHMEIKYDIRKNTQLTKNIWCGWNVPKKISSSVIQWLWIYVFVVLPYLWALLWFSFNIWSRREKRSIFFTLQISIRGTSRHICQYSEYCLNREPYYFRCIRFWHDLFHGIPHKYGKAFKSSRVSSLTGINSETCEQLNSYLQYIKIHRISSFPTSFNVFCTVFYLFVEQR